MTDAQNPEQPGTPAGPEAPQDHPAVLAERRTPTGNYLPYELEDAADYEPAPRSRHLAVIAGATTIALGLVGLGIGAGYALQPTGRFVVPEITVEPGVYQDPSAAIDATDEQKLGVVTILTTLYYDDNYEAAGTGMILTDDGQVLTNNHVIEGATSIEVTIESTGETYKADIVGSDETADVAVLQLEDASDLDVVTFDHDGAVIGDLATSIGNANGTGDLVAATGPITRTDETITVGDETDNSTVKHLYEVDADVVSGDSGGPLLDADGEVIGMVTAASSGSRNVTGYAIEIAVVLAVVTQIQSGVETDTVQIGPSAFFGVNLAEPLEGQVGALVGGVIDGMPAAAAGLASGDLITAVDGDAVDTAETLSALISAHEPGDTVAITFTDASGVSQTVTVVLAEGPAS